MPKTGSQTVEASLEHCSLPHRIVRCHFLSRHRVAELRNVLHKPDVSPAWKRQLREQINTISRLSVALRVRAMLRRCGLAIPKLEIITAVREPIGLALSSIFQNYLYFVPRPEALTLDACNDILQRPKMFTALEEWFDLELRPLVGIDVYATPFPWERGHLVYENFHARVLLYRFDALHQLENIISRFIGREVPHMESRNVGRKKHYGPCYEQVQKQLCLPRDFVLRRYESKLACHFYSSRELANFVQRWCAVGSSASDSPGSELPKSIAS